MVEPSRALGRPALILDYAMPEPHMRSTLSVHAHVSGVVRNHVEVLPAMLPNLHIRLSGVSHYVFGDGHMVASPRVSLIGPTFGAYSITMEPGFSMVCVGLLPQGWLALMGVSASEMRDAVTDGASVWGQPAVDLLCDALLESATPRRRMHCLEQFLVDRMMPQNPGASDPITAIDAWLETSPDLDLTALSQTLDVGPRHLRRLTQRTHGASPKTLAMKYRSLRAAATLALNAERSLDPVRPYADQSHMIRDFRRFVGWTPAAFVDGAHNVAASTLRGRRLADAHGALTLLS